jgi:O-antigen ligase
MHVSVNVLFGKLADILQPWANQAHDNVLEVCLESGVLGVALMLVFLLWLVRRTIVTWRRSFTSNVNDQDVALTRAATVVLFLLAAHSFVDYPLRTAAMMSVAALACGLLVKPPRSGRTSDAVARTDVAAERSSRREAHTGRGAAASVGFSSTDARLTGSAAKSGSAAL